jgi:hypothetical protein
MPGPPTLTNMAEPDPDHFEMRRLESLSNTIFGVAMTLMAYDLPRGTIQRGAHLGRTRPYLRCASDRPHAELPHRRRVLVQPLCSYMNQTERPLSVCHS